MISSITGAASGRLVCGGSFLSRRSQGFTPVETGLIGNRYTEDDLVTFGTKNRDQELATYGLWSKLGFAHYIAAERA